VKPNYKANSSNASTGTDSLKKVAVSSKAVRSRFKSENENTSFSQKRDFSLGRFKKPVKQKIQPKHQWPVKKLEEKKLEKGSNFDASAAWKNYHVSSRSFKEGAQDIDSKVLNLEIKNTTLDDLDLITSKSSDTNSIKELRSKFEQPSVLTKRQQESSQKLPAIRNSNPESTRQLKMGSTMIGSGIYLKNSNIQAMSSLGSETMGTTSGSIKSEAHEGTVGDSTLGDGTLDTRMVLKYARKLEKREAQAATKILEQSDHTDLEECESIPSFENSIGRKDTNTSSKENNASDFASLKAADSNITGSDNFSNVKLRKKAFEFKKNQAVAQKYQQYTKTPERKKGGGSKASAGAAAEDGSLTPKKEVSAYAKTPERKNRGGFKASANSTAGDALLTPKKGAPALKVAPANTKNNMQAASPATTIRDRISAFGGPNTTLVKNLSRSPNKALPRQHRSPNKAVSQTQASPNKIMPLQQQFTPSPCQPVTMKNRRNSPSPAWVAKQNGQGFSPVDNLYGNGSLPLNSNARNRLPPVAFPTPPPLNMQTMSTETYAGKVRPLPVQTACESPNASDYEDAEEDGITLSPTFSEVSGLTLPTCLDVDSGSKMSHQSDVFDNLQKTSLFHESMSPIARHRYKEQPEKPGLSSTLTAGARISKHPYLQRVNTKISHASSGELPRNKHADSTDHIHEMPTPRAKGGLNQAASKRFSRREQIVRRVRASPRAHKNFPQHPSQGGNVKSSSQEWQEQNVIAEHSISQSSSGGQAHMNFPQHSTHSGNVKPSRQQWQERNVIAEHNPSLSSSGDNSSPFNRYDNFGVLPAKPQGRVAERVTQVNQKNKKQSSNNVKRTSRNSDCIRID